MAKGMITFIERALTARSSIKVKVAIVLLIAATVLLWPQSNQSVGPKLRLQIPYEPVTLDFSLAEDGVSLRVLSALMVGLLSYDRDYKLQLEIAEKMEVLDGGRRYRFKLKPWKWSDGKVVTASDFVYAFKRTLDPATPAKLADLLFFIKGARAYKRGEIADFSKVGISSTGEDQLEFSLNTPVSFFPHVLTLPVGYPQRSDQVEKLGAQWHEHMASTGPYKLVRWVHDQRIEVDHNASYQRFEQAAPSAIAFQFIPEEATAVNLFENKRVDVLFKVPAFDLPRLQKKGLVREYPYFATYYIAFDQRQSPWNDRRARLAVAQSINRKQIVDAIGGNEAIATSWIPKGLPGYNDAIGVKHDPVEAGRNWRASRGARMKELLLGFDTSFRNQTVVERIQFDVREHLGVNLTLRNRDWKTYLRELGTEPPPLYRFGWLSPFVDAYANLVVFESDNPNNYTGWGSKEYDALLQKIAVLQAGTPARQKLIDQAQRILVEEAVTVIPIFHYNQAVVVSPEVEGFWVNGMGMVDYMKIRLKKKDI